MSYSFHDIKHILQPYLDDLPTHSMCFQDHLAHLRAISYVVVIITYD
jgi:hypothetical protein